MARFLWLLLVLPFAEVVAFVWVGRHIGLLPTLGLTVLTAVAGVALVQWQGFSTLARARGTLLSGRLPARELVDGLLIVAAGLMLLTPGFITDAVGFLLLFPPVRAVVRRGLMARFRLQVQSRQRERRASDTEIVDVGRVEAPREPKPPTVP